MGRKSLAPQRRAELVAAYARVLADHGQGGATIAAIAAEAGVAAGLVHHYFSDKQALQHALLRELVARFHRGLMPAEPGAHAPSYSAVALGLGPQSDTVAARAWVALFAEAQSDPQLFQTVRRLLDTETDAICRRSGGVLSTADACAVLSYTLGALVFGAFAPRKSPGFAASRLEKLMRALGEA